MMIQLFQLNMSKTLINVALLASLALAGSCHLSHTDSQASVKQPVVNDPQTGSDSIESRAIPHDSLPPVKDLEDEMFSSTTLIISYDNTADTVALIKAIAAYGAEVIYRYDNIQAIAISIPDGKDIHQAIDHFSQVPGVTAVNRDRKVRLMRK